MSIQPNTLETAFNKFDQENPVVWQWFCTYALEAIKAGVKGIGGKFIMERIRWKTMIETTGSTCKINNNHTSYYVRKYRRMYPEWAHLFETRKVKGDFQP